jgi:hypothetical protein
VRRTGHAARLSPWDLTHQGKRVRVEINEKRHPQIVIFKLRDQVRLAAKLNAAAGQRLERRINVANFEIDDGTGMVILGLLWYGQHETDAIAIEERHVVNLKDELEIEQVSVKLNRRLKVMDGNRNLSDFAET